MGLKYQCEGSDIAGISALRSRLSTLTYADSRPEAMAESDSEMLRIWVGPDAPKDTQAWVVEAQSLPDGNRLLEDHPQLLLLALIRTASGVVPEMHVVHERSRTPVYFPNRSELEGYFAERLASIQEIR